VATSKPRSTSNTDKLVLVSPDGEDTREVTTAADEVALRWRGYLPAEQAKLEAPEPPKPTPPAPPSTSNPS